MNKSGLLVIIVLMGVIIALILTRGCGRGSSNDGIDIELIYDSLKRDIVSKLPPPDTIDRVTEKQVIKWLPSARVVDTIYLKGETVYVYNDAEIDTNAILTHYLTQAVTYVDTIEDSALQAVISDVIFRNQIRERGFTYKWKLPTTINHVDNTDRFQFHVMAGLATSTDMDSIYRIRPAAGFMMEFKSGTSVIVKYDHTIGSEHPHGFEFMAAQRLRFRNKKPHN